MEYIGMDVHNRYCQVAILDDDSTDPEECRIKAERAELEEFAREHQGAQAAIEATRNYWFIYDCLQPHLDVSVANPHETGLISDQKVKNDRLDAKRLAVLLRVDALPTSYIPPDEFREARKLVRRRKALVDDRTAAKNRVRAALADRGITYDGDLFGPEGREFLADEELPLSAADRDIIEADLEVIETLDDQIERLQREIDEIAATWEETQRCAETRQRTSSDEGHACSPREPPATAGLDLPEPHAECRYREASSRGIGQERSPDT